MKNKIISLILLVTTLLCSNVFAFVIFTDVPDTHWARQHIYSAQYYNIINGYEDGSFKPENQVKTGEFVKMIAMAMWPEYEYKAPEEGVHWAMPYVKSLDRIILMKNEYTPELLEKVITRTEAARLLCLFYANSHGIENLDNKEDYITSFKDQDLVTDPTERMAIDECVKFGLINGFEDGTFRPNEGLTRAQAAKILCLTISN